MKLFITLFLSSFLILNIKSIEYNNEDLKKDVKTFKQCNEQCDNVINNFFNNCDKYKKNVFLKEDCLKSKQNAENECLKHCLINLEFAKRVMEFMKISTE